MSTTEIGRIARRFRVKREWTLQKMAQVVRINPSSLRRIELGKCLPNDVTVHKLAKVIPELELFDVVSHAEGQSESATDGVEPVYETLAGGK